MNCKTFPLHGSMENKERTSSISSFKAEKSALLLSTDVLARGVDIPKVSYIIQYDPPGEATEYVHRCVSTPHLILYACVDSPEVCYMWDLCVAILTCCTFCIFLCNSAIAKLLAQKPCMSLFYVCSHGFNSSYCSWSSRVCSIVSVFFICFFSGAAAECVGSVCVTNEFIVEVGQYI